MHQPADRPRVSVVVATYNRADMLGENVQSVLNQTYDNYEAVYVDDGSTDNSPRLLAEFAQHARVPFRIVRTEHVGPGRARNAGVRAASGDYVLFLDDDATAPPDWIATMVAQCNAHDCDVLCGGIGAYDTTSPVAHYLHLRMQRTLGPKPKRLKAAPTGNLMIRKAKFDEVGGFSEEELWAAEDWELCHRLRQAGATIMYDPAATVIHRYQSDRAAAVKRMRTTGAVGVHLAKRMHGSPAAYTAYSVMRYVMSPVWIPFNYPARLWGLAWRMEMEFAKARFNAYLRAAMGLGAPKDT